MTQAPDFLSAVFALCTGLADADEPLHRFPPLFAVTEIAFAHCLPDEFGHGRLLPASTGVERSPQLLVEIQLSASHDVYCYIAFAGNESAAFSSERCELTKQCMPRTEPASGFCRYRLSGPPCSIIARLQSETQSLPFWRLALHSFLSKFKDCL